MTANLIYFSKEEWKNVKAFPIYWKHIATLNGNIQIADVPDRHEPGTGEVDYNTFLAALDQLGYSNWVACEYTPSSNTLDSLSWMGKWVNTNWNSDGLSFER